MKNKNLVILGLVALSLSACVKVNVETNSPKDETTVAETKKDVVETAASPHVENTSSKSSYGKNVLITKIYLNILVMINT